MAHFFFVTFFSLLTAHISQAQSSCLTVNSETQKFTDNQYDNCNELPHLDSYILWSLNASENRLSFAFSARPPTGDGWISWAINPTGDGMAGAQALVAFRASNGSMAVKTYNISSYSSITEGKLAFNVLGTNADYLFGLMTIYATIELPEKGMKSVNQVWQVGPSVSSSGFPAKHAFQPENLGAKGRLDLSSEENSRGPDFLNSDDDSDYGSRKRNIHGILNAVSWGILFPTGVIIARHLRTFPAADPTWFYLHAFCQVSAYAIGVAGWATGLKLGSESKGVTYSTHRNIGITLFSLATVQIFALFLRPNKDHKFRFYWNNYHHGIGYSIIVLGILNVFKGLDILSPESKWRSAYIIAISTLGAIALLLEVITWIVVFKRKSSKSTKPYDNKQEQLAP